MHVGLDLTPLLDEWTGTDIAMAGLAEALLREDSPHRYTVFVKTGDAERLGSLLARARVRTVGVRGRLTRLVALHVALPVYTRRLGIDVLHSPSFLKPAWRGGCAHVVTVYDMTSFSSPGWHIPLRGSLPYRAMLSRSIRSADRVIVPSRHTGEGVSRFVPGFDRARLALAPLGVDAIFAPQPPDATGRVLDSLGVRKPYVLAVSTIEPRKNLARLLDAFERVAARHPGQLTLVLAGRRGWKYGDVFERARRLADAGRLVMTGYVPRETLPALYSGASAFAYPSLEEGFGLPPLEAMACGAPVVAGRNSAMLETLEGAATLVDAADPDAIAAALGTVLSEPNLRDRLVAAGSARAASYSWSRAARATLDTYRSAVDDRVS